MDISRAGALRRLAADRSWHGETPFMERLASMPRHVVGLLCMLVLAPISGALLCFVSVSSVAAAMLGVGLLAWLVRAGRYGIVIAFCLLSGLYTELTDPYYAPPVNVAGISLHYLDFLLVVSVIVWLRSPACREWRRGPQLLLAVFIVWTTVVGLARSVELNVDVHTWTRELRTILWYGFAFTLTGLLTTRARVISTAKLLLVTSLGVAGMAAFIRVFHADFVPQTNLLSYQTYGVRIFQVDGVERATYATIFAFGVLLATRWRWLWGVMAANTITLVVALTRGAYLALLVGVVVLNAALGLRGLPGRLARLGTIAAIASLMILGLDRATGENVSTGFIDRVMQIDDLTSGSGNVKTRLTEWEVVWTYLAGRPESLVLGLGLGGTFEDPFDQLRFDGAEAHLGDARFSYVHNGYLWVVLRSGVIGTLLLYGFCAALVGRCLWLAHRTRDPELRGVLLGVGGVFATVLSMSWSGQPLGEGMRMTVLMAYAALGLATIRLVEQPEFAGLPAR